MHFIFADRLAQRGDLGGEQPRGQTTAGQIDDDALEFDAGHSLGGVDRQPNGALGGVEIDDRAGLDPARALMSDAQNLAAMRSPARCVRALDRREASDQANDFRRADVEDRKHRALAGRDLAQARRQRLEHHGAAPFLARACGARSRSVGGKPREHAALGAKIEPQNVALENARLALQGDQRRHGRRADRSPAISRRGRTSS